MKKIFAMVLVLAMLIGMIPTVAMAAETVASGTCGENVTWTLDSEGVLTIEGEGAMYNYTGTGFSTAPWYKRMVKSAVIKEGVTSIGSRAFEFNYSYTGYLTSVTIPSGVTEIGAFAFSGCVALASVTIPGGVTDIGEGAFSSCSGLTDVTISKGVNTIGAKAFRNCTGLTSITIPNSVTSIGAGAFGLCDGLKTVTLEEGNTAYKMVDGAICTADGKTLLLCAPSRFEGGASTHYTIPMGVTTIEEGAFYNCSGMTSVTIPNSVTSIQNSAFKDCSGLTSVTIPSSVTDIGDSAFAGCTSLASVVISEGVSTIGTSAFNGCSKLAEVTIPNGVKQIKMYTFYGCTSLKTVNIPDTLTYIGQHAFFNCTSLKNIDFPYGSMTGGGEGGSFGVYAFGGCTSLESIALPEGVKNLNSNIFNGCTNLKTVYLPASLTDACTSVPSGWRPFTGCTQLKTVYVAPDMDAAVVSDFKAKMKSDFGTKVTVTTGSAPVSVGSETTMDTILTDVSNKGTSCELKLTKDIVCKSDVTIGALGELTGPNVTIDLNGHTLDLAGYYSIKVYPSTLTIKDSSAAKTGKIINGCPAINIMGATVNMTGGTITQCDAVDVGDWGSMTVAGGVNVLSSGAFNMTGGKITGCKGFAKNSIATPVPNFEGGGVYVDSGTITMSADAIVYGNVVHPDYSHSEEYYYAVDIGATSFAAPTPACGYYSKTNNSYTFVHKTSGVTTVPVGEGTIDEVSGKLTKETACAVCGYSFGEKEYHAHTVNFYDTSAGIEFAYWTPSKGFTPVAMTPNGYKVATAFADYGDDGFENIVIFMRLNSDYDLKSKAYFKSSDGNLVIDPATAGNRQDAGSATLYLVSEGVTGSKAWVQDAIDAAKAQGEDWVTDTYMGWFTWSTLNSTSHNYYIIKADVMNRSLDDFGSEKVELAYWETGMGAPKLISSADLTAAADGSTYLNITEQLINDVTPSAFRDIYVMVKGVEGYTADSAYQWTRHSSQRVAYSKAVSAAVTGTLAGLDVLPDSIKGWAQENGYEKVYALPLSGETTSYYHFVKFSASCDHSGEGGWGDWTETLAATCTTDGSKTHTCARCGVSASETIPAHHTYVDHAAQAATCTAIGWDAYQTCANCDYTSYVEISALGHDYVDHAAQAATCTAIGWNAYQTCAREGCDYTTYVEIPALGHDWGAWGENFPGNFVHSCLRPGCGLTEYCKHANVTETVVTAGDCETDGESSFKCNDCGKTWTETTPAGHNWVETTAQVDPGCETAGTSAIYTCSKCSNTKGGDVIKATGHDWSLIKDAGTPATCGGTGIAATLECSVCHNTSGGGELEATGDHKMVHVDHKDATCTEGGVAGGEYCWVCDYNKTAVMAVTTKSGHTWGEWVITTKPTAETAGVAMRSCSVCSAVVSQLLPQLPADTTDDTDYTVVITAEPNCVTAGQATYTDKANGTVTAVVIPALGHTEVSADNAVASTCTVAGKDSDTVCSVCGNTLTVGAARPLAAHTPAAAVTENVVAATCKDGSHDEVVYCADCGVEISRVAKTDKGTGAHDWDNGVTSGSMRTYTCKTCGDTYQVAVVTETVVVKNPTPSTPAPSTPATTTPAPTEEIEDEDTPLAGLPKVFLDIVENAWYSKAVKKVAAAGLMFGIEDGTNFHPNGKLTRAMAVTTIHRLAGKPEAEGENPFFDVEENSWYTEAVIWAAENGIVLGYDNGAFGVDDYVTREQMAVMMYRYCSLVGEVDEGEVPAYPDADIVSSWAEKAVRWAVKKGCLHIRDGKLEATETATRAEVAYLLAAFLEDDEVEI